MVVRGVNPEEQGRGSESSAVRPAPRALGRLLRSVPGVIGLGVLALMLAMCLGTLPWTLGRTTIAASGEAGRVAVERYNVGALREGRLPPFWVRPSAAQRARLNQLVPESILEGLLAARRERDQSANRDDVILTPTPAEQVQLRAHWPRFWLGTDLLGRSLLIRCLAGGGVSLTIGLAAALLSVAIGTLYGSIAGYAGGRVDAVMMRIVDVLYGLPYILLVVLLAVASDALLDEYVSRQQARAEWVQRAARAELAKIAAPTKADDAAAFLARDAILRARLEREAEAALPARHLTERQRTALDVGVLLVAIGGISWLTMARVVRGQVLSLKAQPFVEAARAIGVGPAGVFRRHLLPNLVGPITVYATLTVPQAILQESFLSFLGIGVRPPLPSWGSLAAEGLPELNPYQSHWWLLGFPCALLGITLLSLNFVGEGLREALDPRRVRR